MGTKINPGKFDCYANAKPDEPLFVILARDPNAAVVVRFWARMRLALVRVGKKPISDLDMVREAEKLADEMETWHKERKTNATSI